MSLMRSQTICAYCCALLFCVGLVFSSSRSDVVAYLDVVTYTVSSSADSGPGTLREAIASANANPEPSSNIIEFDSSVVGTIELASPLPAITKAVTITGPGASTLSIDANGTGRVLTFASSTHDQSFTLSELTITGGSSTSAGGGILVNTGDSLTIDSCTITGNSSSLGSGGIHHVGNLLSIMNSTISQNQATGSFHGGGLSFQGTLLSLTNSTVGQNSADGFGGGIYILQATEVLIMESAIINNSALYGGGLQLSFFTSPTLSLINTTVSGNTAGEDGGGIHLLNNSAAVNLGNVTVTNNTADNNEDGSGNGGGLWRMGEAETEDDEEEEEEEAEEVEEEEEEEEEAAAEEGGGINIKNSVLSNNTDKGGEANDCFASLNSQGYNLIRDTAACGISGNLTGNLPAGSDPLLAALAGNGGATQTHALQLVSPLIDAGNPAGCNDHVGGPLLTDQRGSGFARDADGDNDGTPRCDIGAFELICGNGIIDAAEACDDGNTSNTDACLNTCVAASCGDGFIQTSVEACDDGNVSAGDGCSSSCVVEVAPEPTPPPAAIMEPTPADPGDEEAEPTPPPEAVGAPATPAETIDTSSEATAVSPPPAAVAPMPPPEPTDGSGDDSSSDDSEETSPLGSDEPSSGIGAGEGTDDATTADGDDEVSADSDEPETPVDTGESESPVDDAEGDSPASDSSGGCSLIRFKKF